MIKRSALWAGIMLLAVSIFMGQARAATIVERLQFDLTWAGIKAGTAELEIQDTGPYIQYISRARSSSFVSVFYRVEDLVVSSLKKEEGGYGLLPGKPYSYRMQISEGRHKRDKEVFFDYERKKATYINHLGKEQLSFDIHDGTMDALSSFHYLRKLPLNVGKTVYIEIFDSKKLYKLEVQVVGREEVMTPAGTFKTILVKPVMLSEGIFNKRGDILIWLTDDSRRLPVMLRTKVKVGSVSATLTGGTYPQQ